MILIFGINGMLGNYIYKYLSAFFNVKGTAREEFDVYELFTNQNLNEMIHELLSVHKPKYIINCIL